MPANHELLQQLQFHAVGPREIEGRIAGETVTRMGWDSSHTIDYMETHPQMRRQGLMDATWNHGVSVAGYLRQSPDRTDDGQGFARYRSDRDGRKLPRRQSKPEFHGAWE